MEQNRVLNGDVLIIDDEDIFREDLARILRSRNLDCRTASDGRKGIEVAREFNPQVVLCDLIMPEMSGLQVLEELREQCPESFVVLVTAHGSLQTAVEGFRRGAIDYVLKPVLIEDILQKVHHLFEHRALLREVKLRRELAQRTVSPQMLGRSEAMEGVRRLVEQVAPTRSTVLLLGESGTGKELVARAIHAASESKQTTFIPVNCAAIPEALLESELFGHTKGAFTGAEREKTGLMMAAGEGTLFLDEIGDMPLSLQAKLLRVLETREVRPVGSTQATRIECRFLASTNRNLEQMVEEGTFRRDLLYRILVVEIVLPPLRERTEDIATLAEHFVKRCNRDLKRGYLGVESQALRLFEEYSWPGNIRELQNVIERAAIVGDGRWIRARDLPPDINGGVEPAPDVEDLREAIRSFERAHIRRILEACGGKRLEAANRLKVHPATLYRRISDLGLE